MKLNVVMNRKFKGAVEAYRKEMKTRRRSSSAASLKLAPPVMANTAAPPPAAVVSPPVPIENSSPEPPSILSLGINPTDTTTEENLGEEIYEQLDQNVPDLPNLPTRLQEEDGMYELPPSGGDGIEPHDYEYPPEEGPDTPKRPSRVPPVISRELRQEPQAAPLPDNPRDWTPSEVLRWLKDNHLDSFKDIFYANSFSGLQLLALTAASFKTAGVSRDKVDQLMASIATLKQGGSAAASSASSGPSIPRRVVPPPPPAETPAPVSNEKRARVEFGYEAAKEGHLTIIEGEEVVVLDDTRKWWLVRNASGAQGSVPSNYLAIIEGAGSSTANADLFNLDSFEWFVGDMERPEAEDRLKFQTVGTFLVRRNLSDFSDLTLSIKGSQATIHLKLKAVDGKYALGSGSGDSSSIPELIDFHRHSEIKVTGKEHIMLRRTCGR